MDARRLGHGLALPLALLEAATPAYLTDVQWDSLQDDWLEQALAYVTEPVRGARGPLTRIRPRPGDPDPVPVIVALGRLRALAGRDLGLSRRIGGRVQWTRP